jgi:hypothetical protein
VHGGRLGELPAGFSLQANAFESGIIESKSFAYASDTQVLNQFTGLGPDLRRDGCRS